MTQKKIKAPCNECQTKTLHDVLFTKENSGSEDMGPDFSIEWAVKWTMIQCCGCESMSLMSESTNSEDYDPEHGENVTTSYYPPRTFRHTPLWMNDRQFKKKCPDAVISQLEELYVAVQNDCYAAATMLTRAIFEHVMIHLAGKDLGTFKDNIKEFRKGGWITEKNAELLETFLEAGHATMHRAFIPDKDVLVALIDILEGILLSAYIQIDRFAKLRSTIPTKIPKATAATAPVAPPPPTIPAVKPPLPAPPSAKMPLPPPRPVGKPPLRAPSSK